MKSSLSSPTPAQNASVDHPPGIVDESVPLSVPLLDLRRQYAELREQMLAAIARVCDSQIYILGPEVEALEREIGELTGAGHAVGCSSGTEALWLALVAAGVKPGDAVITTAFSFFASASAIVRAGATPVFVDVDPGTLNLDPALVERTLREWKVGTKMPSGTTSGEIRAILPVHLYGQCADMDALQHVAREHAAERVPGHAQGPLAIVEDAAQAIGAEWNGRDAGSLGVTAAFSFYPTKNLSAYGDAGIVTTTSPEAATHMRQLRNHGSPQRYYHDEFGWNGRLDAIQAAVLRVKLPYIAEWNERRRQHAATYDRLLAEAGLTSNLPAGETKAPVCVLARDSRAKHVFHQYVIRAQRRDELRKFLAERKIGSEIYYPLPLHLQPVFSYLGLKAGDMPVAEQAAREVLALPMFPELREAEIRRVVDCITDFYS